MSEVRARVLFVDDDSDFLAAIARNLRSSQFEVSIVPNAATGLETLEKKGPFAVLVSDLRMPGMSGVELLRNARRVAPDTTRVLFTGQLDIEHALTAVNEGAIFRFLIKPCPIIVVATTVRAAAEQHRLVTSERVLLEQTLRGSIEALTEVLALASPLAFGRAARVRETLLLLAKAMGVEDQWQIEIAAMLSQVACVTLPPPTLEKVYKGEDLNEQEMGMIGRLPGITEQVLSHIPRLEGVMEILRFSQKRYDGGGLAANGRAGDDLPWGARALRIVLDLDRLENKLESRAAAIQVMAERKGWYDPWMIETLRALRPERMGAEICELPLIALAPGMVLAKDIRTRTGMLYMARGQAVTPGALEKLRNCAPQLQEPNSVRVFVDKRKEEVD